MTDPAASAPPRLPRSSKGKRPNFFAEPGLDHAMSMILTLASEVCVLRDRLDAHERVAKTKGLDMAAEIDALELDEAALQEREQWRQDFLSRLYALARKEADEAAAKASKEQYDQTIADIAVGKD